MTHDYSAICVASLQAGGHLVVDAIRVWKGTKAKPVLLQTVCDEIVTLSRRFQIGKVMLDQWQAALMGEQLKRAGLTVRFVSMGPAMLDTLATNLKSWFVRRSITIPSHAGLLEQLETLEGAESRRGNRIRFTEGSDGQSLPPAVAPITGCSSSVC